MASSDQLQCKFCIFVKVTNAINHALFGLLYCTGFGFCERPNLGFYVQEAHLALTAVPCIPRWHVIGIIFRNMGYTPMLTDEMLLKPQLRLYLNKDLHRRFSWMFQKHQNKFL
jgi:hypothetical protein